MNNEILPLCVSTTLKCAVGKRIVLIVVAKQVNAVRLTHRGFQPVTGVLHHLGCVIKIVEVVTEEDNFIGTYGSDDSFCLFLS